jgi:hypothetical protein
LPANAFFPPLARKYSIYFRPFSFPGLLDAMEKVVCWYFKVYRPLSSWASILQTFLTRRSSSNCSSIKADIHPIAPPAPAANPVAPAPANAAAGPVAAAVAAPVAAPGGKLIFYLIYHSYPVTLLTKRNVGELRRGIIICTTMSHVPSGAISKTPSFI